MNERLKQIRSANKMNQHDFAASLGIGQSTLAMMEVGKREITERHIKTICAIYGVNEHWFKTGDGEIFKEDHEKKGAIDRLTEEYKLTGRERAIISSFLELNAKARKVILDYVTKIADEVNKAEAESPDKVPREEKSLEDWTDQDIAEEAEAYRQQLEREKRRAERRSALQGSSSYGSDKEECLEQKEQKRA